jgi:hypothetical protein
MERSPEDQENIFEDQDDTDSKEYPSTLRYEDLRDLGIHIDRRDIDEG